MRVPAGLSHLTLVPGTFTVLDDYHHEDEKPDRVAKVLEVCEMAEHE